MAKKTRINGERDRGVYIRGCHSHALKLINCHYIENIGTDEKKMKKIISEKRWLKTRKIGIGFDPKEISDPDPT